MTSVSDKPPKHLRTATKRWFRGVIQTFELEPHHILLLRAAAESWDRKEEAREQLAKDGLTFVDRLGNVRSHPAVQIERDSRQAFMRALRELSLDVDAPPEAPRPPQLPGTAGRK
jgi:P27 family predicted phage terminase small subunit